MDEIRIRSRFMKKAISKIVKKVIYQKIGYNVDIGLNDFEASMTDERAHVHLDVDLCIGKKELSELLKKLG